MNKRSKQLWSLAAGAVLLLLGQIPSAMAASFRGLGYLPGGSFSSSASDVSADGSVVVGSASSGTAPGQSEAFRWSAETGMVGLGDLPGSFFRSNGYGVSDDGLVVVGESLGTSGIEAFRWSAETGMVGLGDLPGGYFTSSALGVSADGSVVVGQGSSFIGPNGNSGEAFRWSAETGMVSLGDLPGGSFYSFATDVSADGSVVVGGGSSASRGEAFRWSTQTGMIGLGELPSGNNSFANAISADGSVVVGTAASGTTSGQNEAFRWSAQTGMVGLGDLPGSVFRSGASDVSANGSVVVGQGFSTLGFEAFIWDKVNGMRSLQNVLTNDFGLDLRGWRLSRAAGISADGLTIVGSAYNPSNRNEAWIAQLDAQTVQPVPEPSTLLGSVLLMGFGAFFQRRQQRQAKKLGLYCKN